MTSHQGIVTEVGSRSVRVFVAGVGTFRCTLRGNLWNAESDESKPVAVGDRVAVLTEGGEDGVVESVEERKNRLARPQPGGRDGLRKGRGGRTNQVQVIAANIDRLVIVSALVDPPFREGLVDRLLVSAAMEGIDPVLVVNKVDLVPDGLQQAAGLLEPYRRERLPTFATSATSGVGIDALRQEMSAGISLLVGHSGSGKSSLLNAVSPGLRLGTGVVADFHGRGRHTTTRVSLLALGSGGFVVDSPGFREFGLGDVPQGELARLFPGLHELPDGCRFNDCLHRNEPGCAVRAAVAAGQYPQSRYEGYIRLLDELAAERAR